ncbi:MAG: hypothetical protein JO197_21660 [Acidobacteria bacterium]|nr:hypothetical protein [Acidobacteriota bacterium]MBV9474742.1 hypothetical protein [Acidobacteriota bacterium]
MDKTEKLIDWEENEREDRNRNGLSDDIEPPIPDIAAGAANFAHRLKNDPLADPTISGGDLDAQWEGAQFSGDESAVSSMPTPDQSVVEEIGAAMGVTYQDNEELKVGEKERSRDIRRWELDPASSDDYQDRVRDEER